MEKRTHAALLRVDDRLEQGMGYIVKQAYQTAQDADNPSLDIHLHVNKHDFGQVAYTFLFSV
ncbi:hypothetical protein GCM10011346_03230 [Oceanobacillus neutriphilus]|uniref:Uncharacterized protein n=1 Tax=Oceanobacillus neutriphilus TaxID=531815 RepID=A0ABQ2NTF5_9BACI|nr:hypothetical protein GCM10011346_03230 [Oceanobacillus neutriphilus]